jgi:beta-galactosidase
MPDSPSREPDPEPKLTRRGLLRAGAAGGAALTVGGVAATGARAAASKRTGRMPGLQRAAGRGPRSALVPSFPTTTYDFNPSWRFGGLYAFGEEQPSRSIEGWTLVNLPHTVTPLSWGDWNPSSWQKLWIYRKQFDSSSLTSGRVFVDFDAVMTDATVYLNGIEMAGHQGGFLPFSVELSDLLLPGVNDLAVVVDGRLLDAPPLGSAKGAEAIDYLCPAGIYRDTALRHVPTTFVSDIFAKPLDVLGSPALHCQVSIDCAEQLSRPVELTVALMDGRRVLRHATITRRLAPGTSTFTLTLSGLRELTLWSPERPALYTVTARIESAEIPTHTLSVTTGLREARFEVDGFYLNGSRYEIFGLNRHQLYPYTGMAAPARLQARDAQHIKQVLNCNMVRCSHYPQSPHFLDACDQLGLLVWEEAPGWQYVGDQNFDAVFLQNVNDMVIRDRNRPSVIVWGTRLDETSSYPTLYAEARQLAYSLDGTRQTTGAMATQSTAGWAEDLFAYDDYNGSGGNATPLPPLPGLPYMISEAVGALTGAPLYRWIDSSATLQMQARLHAQVFQVVRGNEHYAGALGWCAIDYQSLLGGDRNWQTVRWPGVTDIFRVPKPGAAFYRSQVDPATTPLVIPAFYWDFGPNSPSTGPGPGSLLFTNCQQLEVYVGAALSQTLTPDRTDYGNLAWAPCVADLTVGDASSLPDLHVVGYIGGRAVTELRMSSNPALDRLVLDLEDSEIVADGSDATRVSFRALDAYGNQRPYVTGNVSLSLAGPAQLIGQNPFAFEEYGGVGGAIIRSQAGRTGQVTLSARHPTLGAARVTLRTVPPTGARI